MISCRTCYWGSKGFYPDTCDCSCFGIECKVDSDYNGLPSNFSCRCRLPKKNKFLPITQKDPIKRAEAVRLFNMGVSGIIQMSIECEREEGRS